MTDAEKARAFTERRRLYFAFLDARIPELHREGVKGAAARSRADAEYARRSDA